MLVDKLPFIINIELEQEITLRMKAPKLLLIHVSSPWKLLSQAHTNYKQKPFYFM